MIHRAFGRPLPATSIPAPPSPLELAACYRYCEALARSRHHNFPVASRFLSSRLRPHALAVYAFARTADDFADEPRFAGRRALELDRWEDMLEACYHGQVPEHPVYVALADTISSFDLPITPFSSLLAGFRADLETSRYSTFQDLRGYTALAAEPVGDLFLYLSGYRDPALLGYGRDLATGLALAHFWQDIPADLARGRVYVPEEDLRHFGLAPPDLRAAGASERPELSPRLDALFRFQVARTRSLLERARPLVDLLGDDIAVEMAISWHGGMRILDKIYAAGARVLRERPRLTRYDKAQVVSRAVAWRGGSLARRARRRARRR
ncbi:MAG TPA: squalene/phytoene synthase family protein [Kofleriaceae bacterium]|nr:squalene/phytoene synthase family protein [Kofleriaceae bacterium]